ncbi:hypothetical protein LTR48_008965, partial [Friedmanniomyces endolithicus]
MAAVLNAVVVELRGGPISPGKTLASSTTSSIPARRGSSAIDAGTDRPTFKRRQTSRSSKANKPMNPPSNVMSQHRASDASDRHSVVSLAMGQQGDAVLITPRTEGSSSSWPNAHPNDNTFDPPAMFPPPETANMVSSSPHRHNGWMHNTNNNHLTNNDFSSLISMGGLP